MLTLNVYDTCNLSLKVYSKALLGRSIQEGSHDSVEDAKTTMQLFQLVQTKFENNEDNVLVGTPLSTRRSYRPSRLRYHVTDVSDINFRFSSYGDHIPDNVVDLGYSDPDNCDVWYFS